MSGLVWPAFSVVLSEMLGVLLAGGSSKSVSNWSLAFVVVGVIHFVSLYGKFTFLGIAGEALTQRLRAKSFRAIVYKDAAWFDEPRHRKNILTTRLASDAARVRGIVGERLGMCKP